MSKSRAKRGSAATRKESDGHEQRAAYRDRMHRQFRSSLDSLGKSAAGAISADLKTFMRDWRSGMAEPDMNSVWDYKPVGDQKLGVKQIRVATHYRVALMVVRGDHPCIWFLHAYRRKQGKSNRQEIPLATGRARAIREEEHKDERARD